LSRPFEPEDDDDDDDDDVLDAALPLARPFELEEDDDEDLLFARPFPFALAGFLPPVRPAAPLSIARL